MDWRLNRQAYLSMNSAALTNHSARARHCRQVSNIQRGHKQKQCLIQREPILILNHIQQPKTVLSFASNSMKQNIVVNQQKQNKIQANSTQQKQKKEPQNHQNIQQNHEQCNNRMKQLEGQILFQYNLNYELKRALQLQHKQFQEKQKQIRAQCQQNSQLKLIQEYTTRIKNQQKLKKSRKQPVQSSQKSLNQPSAWPSSLSLKQPQPQPQLTQKSLLLATIKQLMETYSSLPDTSPDSTPSPNPDPKLREMQMANEDLFLLAVNFNIMVQQNNSI